MSRHRRATLGQAENSHCGDLNPDLSLCTGPFTGHQGDVSKPIFQPWRFRTKMTRSAVKRGVPRSANHYFKQFRVVRKIDFTWREVQLNGFFDILPRLVFRISCRRTARKFRADR